MNFESFKKLVESTRSIRRFDESRRIGRDTLENLVELTRFCASGRNAQPLRYVLIDSEEECEQIFPLLKWAGYFKEWDGPEKGERPVAYLVQCIDTKYGADCLCDDGLQLEAITLGMTTLGLGGCIIKAFDHINLSKVLNLDKRYSPRYVLAIGYPVEKVVIEEMNGEENADFKYFRTPDGVHHVPKRPLKELILK
ncbi:MAG: nitroreductase family protein [Muribaculaceae bacterium]|nr:nitroreductase family protein [Muribaculaceae bacterium]